MVNSESGVSLVAVGDIQINRRDARSAFRHVKPYLEKFDIVFANLETPLSNKGSKRESGVGCYRGPPENVSGLVYAGFNIVSFANNHSMDYHEEAFIETLDVLDQNGIKYVGAGRNKEEAQKPVVIENKGEKIAFVGFEATPYRFRGRAREDKPGLNKVKIDPLYPPPHINPPDLLEMKDMINTAKSIAPTVVASFHWGVSPASTIVPYQRVLGHSAIDAGADLILGHHPHHIQGIEVYRGRIICYSLGNFMFEYDWPDELNEDLVFHCVISNGNIKEPSIVFAEWINPEREPKIVPQGSSRGAEIFKKLSALSRELNTTLIQREDATRIRL